MMVTMPADRKALFLLPLLLAAAVLACRPAPADSLEYPQFEGAVVVQRITVDDAALRTERALVLPDYTLYGDGTLIYQGDDGMLYRTELSGDAIQTLIEDIDAEGMLRFNYEQPTPERETDQHTTFLYVQTLNRANAVRAEAIDSVLSDDASDEYDEFRGVQDVMALLDATVEEPQASTAPVLYEPDSLLLLVQPLEDPSTAGEPPALPNLDLDLAAIAPANGGPVQHLVEGEQAWTLWETFGGASSDVVAVQGDNAYIVNIVPVLPFAENFPLFDFPE